MNLENSTPELFAALAKAQGEIENATKNAANPHFRSKYADLGEVMSTIRAALPKHGLALIQSPHFDGSVVMVDTVITHELGGYLSATASCVPAKTDAQGIGAATTYLRRYSAAAFVGIHQEDDDGEAAAHKARPATRSLPPVPAAREAELMGKWVQLVADGRPASDLIAQVGTKYALTDAQKSALHAQQKTGEQQ